MDLADAMPTLQVVALCVNSLLVLIILPLRHAIEELQKSDEKMADKVSALELKVAENYVQRGELNTNLNYIISKLDKIDERISAKIDLLESTKVDK